MAIDAAERLGQLLGQLFGGDRLAGLPQGYEDLQQAIGWRVVVHCWPHAIACMVARCFSLTETGFPLSGNNPPYNDQRSLIRILASIKMRERKT